MREWKGSNNSSFEGLQRHAIEEMSNHLSELTAAIKRLSENKKPSVNTDDPVS